MNMKRILLLSSLCLLLGNNTSLAGERTEREMLAIAQTQLQTKEGMTRGAQQIDKLAEDRFYAVYGNDSQGFVVISRDDQFKPVLGYSDSRFPVGHIPCGMAWWLGAISEAMESGMAASPVRTRSAYTPVAPLCKTQWDQDDPYNFLTPELNGKHTPTGCVATAMSQIMKYFEYPAQGKGQGYYTLETNSTRVTEKISSVYQWDKMLDVYKESELTDEIRMPVATLMKDAGLATHMTYGSNGSGAFSVIAARGFAYNFSYDSLAIHAFYRDYFDQTEWMNTIYSELAAGRPLLYTGADGSGGHAFVFDGIDSDGLVHVNWGWGGNCDGFYDIDVLNPKGKSYYFNSQQSMVYGFKCQEKPDDDEIYTSLWCSDSAYKLSLDGKILTIESGPVYNFHFLDFYGTFGVCIKNLDGDSSKDGFKLTHDMGDEATVTFHGIGSLANSILLTGIKSGNYRIYLASKAKNEVTYQPVRVPGGAMCYDLTVTEDGKTSLSEPKFMTASDPVTSIHQTKVKPVDSSVTYDLQGRKVNGEPQRHGVYIRNGKKVIK